MPQINWKPDFSFGNILTIATLDIGLVIGWQTLVGEVKANTEDISALDERVTDQEKRFNAWVQNEQLERIRQTEILTELRTDLKYLRETLTDMSHEVKGIK